MRCGLFGKLPAKRDFVAVFAPRAFLCLWEPWVDEGLAAWRARALPAAFAEAYNSAPIWRFWLGPALCGQAIAGAFMPSVDALGRIYPLTLIGAPPGGATLAAPDVDPRGFWFGKVEALLLDALDPQTPFETIFARLDALGADEAGAEAAPRDPAARAFASLRAEAPHCPPELATFWWTIGGAGCPPQALMRRALPAPIDFADMLSRRAPEPAVESAEAAAQAILWGRP